MNTLKVSQVNTYIKALLDGSEPLQNIYVEGEISNFKHYQPSGHMYFTLKDEKSQLKCVMFSSNAYRIRFRPENGMCVICRGRISAYEKSGEYQLYAEDMQPVGAGALNLAFEQLKKKLFDEGVCDKSRKKPLPEYPQKIGVVTSGVGAAVQDIKNITSRRYPLAELVIVPTAVQGEKAAPEIVESIKLLDSRGDIDVMIVGRGGGSIEDLWAFNTEEVARAVIACNAPVVSAVGHESDFTICDFVADLRAPTPSAAAELICPDINVLFNHVRSLQYTAQLYIQALIDDRSQHLSELTAFSPLANGEELLNAYKDRLSDLKNRLGSSFTNRAEIEFHRFSALLGKLNALSPLAVMERGFAVAKQGESVVARAAQADTKKELTVAFEDGELNCKISGVRLYEQ
ncbi:MAG TPA: exodeoxyribonuclease VII large subunit [Candidatus Eubacterium faecipullorum]|uniref:Exodeoxyribonuclease 7 large subunit n=1 Tax=Candidatus Eubacterium faecipullorum TaxID=2838571 RepID=A0A9D1UFF0_9FIRM|nr:exodeoxyribonuclease VII large subunit [Candidatus Eubacterium faecipullorum]